MTNEPTSSDTPISAIEGDLAKIRLEHRLSVRRLVVDRVFLGLLAGLVLFGADLITERFKAGLAESRFFLEQRHAAATEFRKKLTAVARESLRQTEFACSLDPTRQTGRAPFKEALSAAETYLDSSSLLFSKQYLDRVNRVLNIFGGAAAEDTAISCGHRMFFIELTDYLTHITREEVLLEGAGAWAGFMPEPVAVEALEHMGSMEYHNLNLRKWMALRTNQSGSPAATPK